VANEFASDRAARARTAAARSAWYLAVVELESAAAVAAATTAQCAVRQARAKKNLQITFGHEAQRP